MTPTTTGERLLRRREVEERLGVGHKQLLRRTARGVTLEDELIAGGLQRVELPGTGNKPVVRFREASLDRLIRRAAEGEPGVRALLRKGGAESAQSD